MKTIIFDLDGTLVDLASGKCFASLGELINLRKKYRFALVTGASRGETLSALRQFGLSSLFKDKNFIITKDEIFAPKKSGAPFRKILRLIKGPAVFIGDSQNDFLGCARAGLACVLIEKARGIKQQKINFKKALKRAVSNYEILCDRTISHN